MAEFSALQKCTVAMRMLAYGAPGDSTDDYLRMAESTVFDCFYQFCRAGDSNVWGHLLEITHCPGHCSDPRFQ
jgi:hypothetical protein